MTIREIAKKLGVSPAAVSFVLNDKSGVGAERRQMIQDALLENGYEIKRNEKKPVQPRQVCIVKYRASHQNDEFSIIVLDAIEHYANQAGYTVNFLNIDRNTYEQKISALDLSSLQGIIFFASDMQEDCLQYTMRLPLPMVYVDAFFSDKSVNTVNADQRLIVYWAAEHLHRLGHETIGYLRCVPTRNDLSQRFTYFKAAAEKHGMQLMPDFIFDIDNRPDRIEQALQDALANVHNFPTAIFAESDIIAAKCINLLTAMGKKVPEDISVIGIDNTAVASVASPPLTVIDVNARELGRVAFERLEQLIWDPNRSVVHSYIEPFLVRRKSTGICHQKRDATEQLEENEKDQENPKDG